MNLKILYVFLFLLWNLNLFSQKNTDANIIGDVKDSNTGAHIPFINVSLLNTVIGTTTDQTGHYFLKNLPVGNYKIRVSGVGYKTVEKEVELIAGKTIEVNFLTSETSMSLDEVVVSANRNETNRKDASVVVSVISPKIFTATNAVCMADGLNFQPGVRIETDCNNCGFTQVRINGLEGQYSQILIDSRPVFSALSGVYGLEQIPVNMIERVEVVRGGGSALYGSNAIAGTINIITKEALNNNFSAIYNRQQSGSAADHTVNLNTSIVSDDNKAGMYLYGNYRNRNPYDSNDDGFAEIPKILNHTIGMRSYYRLSSRSKLTLEYHNINEFRRGGNNFDLQPHESDIAEQLEHEINGGGVAYNWFSEDIKHKLNAYMSVQNTKRKSYYGAGKNLNAYGNTNNNTAVGGIQYVYQFDKLFFMPSEFISGVEYQYDDIDDSMPGYNRSLQQTTQTTGLFLQNEWKNSQLNILIGARLDKHNLLKNAVISPRMNLKYNFSKNLNWRGSYAAGFRAPQAFDEDLHLDAVGGTVKMIQIAANLRPEYSHTFSSSLDYYLKLGTVETNFLIEGFSTRINDVFILVDQGLNPNGQIIMERQNGSGARVSGINLEGKIAPSSKILAQFGFTLQKSLYDEAERWSDDLTIAAERKMLRTPSNYGYFTLAYNISKKFTLDATGTYTGSMLAPHLAGYIAKDKLEITPSFVDLNLKGSYNLKLNGIALQISGGVKNILNSYQKDLDSGPNRDGSYVYGPQIPRSFFVGVKFGN
jgi:outer membrane receptor for ferrienterochelin and colicins